MVELEPLLTYRYVATTLHDRVVHVLLQKNYFSCFLCRMLPVVSYVDAAVATDVCRCPLKRGAEVSRHLGA